MENAAKAKGFEGNGELGEWFGVAIVALRKKVKGTSEAVLLVFIVGGWGGRVQRIAIPFMYQRSYCWGWDEAPGENHSSMIMMMPPALNGTEEADRPPGDCENQGEAQQPACPAFVRWEHTQTSQLTHFVCHLFCVKFLPLFMLISCIINFLVFPINDKELLHTLYFVPPWLDVVCSYYSMNTAPQRGVTTNHLKLSEILLTPLWSRLITLSYIINYQKLLFYFNFLRE